jgi:hypothetical protein
MSGLEWGPIAQLAAALRLRRRKASLAWLDRLGQTGSLWQHVARFPEGTFWPPTLPLPSPTTRWQRLWWRAPQRIDAQALSRLLPMCHSWLAAENMRFVAPLLVVDAAACPAWVAHTSDRALVWSLIVFAASSFGPKVILARRGLIQQIARDMHAERGDVLVLHRDVERLAREWLARAGGRACDQSPGARAGGLRTRSFLNAMAVLRKDYRSAISLLASCSPLTRLAYLDVFSDTTGCDVVANAKPDPAKGPAWTEIFAPSEEADDAALWLALVANTLLGALLSTPPALTAWLRAEAHLRNLERQFVRWRYFRRLDSVQLRRARMLASSRKRRWSGALLARLEAWHAIAQDNFSRELHIMVLDRLARLALVRATPAMRDEWSAARRANEQALPKGELFVPGTAYFTELISLVLAVPPDDLRPLLDQDQLLRLGTFVDGILSVPASSYATGSLKRFGDEDSGFRLPFRSETRYHHSVAEVFGELREHFREILPLSQPANAIA